MIAIISKSAIAVLCTIHIIMVSMVVTAILYYCINSVYLYIYLFIYVTFFSIFLVFSTQTSIPGWHRHFSGLFYLFDSLLFLFSKS